MPTRWILLASLLCFGCDGAGVMCGAGTVLVDGVCVVDDSGSTPPPSGGGTTTPPPSGGGTTTPPPADAGTPAPAPDSGLGWGSTPPGGGTFEPGCDAATGECDEWETALAALLGGFAGRGCADAFAIEPAIQGIAEAHASHQATIDRLTASSPDGDLFTQVRDSGASFMYAGATFSVTRDGAEDVMDRWLEDADTLGVLSQCWTGGGVAIDTSESGASYVTVLLVR